MDRLIHYFLVYLAAAGVALATTPVVIYAARRLRLVDRPGTRRVHSSATPRLGGIAVLGTLLGVAYAVLVVVRSTIGTFQVVSPELVVLLATSAAMGFVGLLDDVVKLRARHKLLAELVLAIIVCALGVRVDELVVARSMELSLGWLSWPVSILWILGITNSLNLIDGLDGLAAGIATITCAVIAILAFHTSQIALGVLMIIAIGSLSGFLFFNFNPAKVFLGDCGSLFLGFFVAVASMLCASKSHLLVTLALPAIAMGVPIVDTFLAITRRLLERRHVFSPDRKHIHHRLLDKGFSHRASVILIYAATLLAVSISFLILETRNVGSVVVFLLAWSPLFLIFRVSGSGRINELRNRLLSRQALASEAKRDHDYFQQLQLRLREVKDANEWWQILRRAARFLGFAKIDIEFRHRDAKSIRLVWNHPRVIENEEPPFRASFSARPFGIDTPLLVSLEIRDHGLLESAGRRVALFGRLLDEHQHLHLPPIEEQLGGLKRTTLGRKQSAIVDMLFTDMGQYRPFSVTRPSKGATGDGGRRSVS